MTEEQRREQAAERWLFVRELVLVLVIAAIYAAHALL
jgi:hypothetical protein